MLRESGIYQKFETNQPDSVMLGDSAYPLLPWLMTPYANPTIAAQEHFNNTHAKTICTVERISGVLKRRFTCLNYLLVEPPQGCNIILACIVLHNIAITHNVPAIAGKDLSADLAESLGHHDESVAVPQQDRLGGLEVRDAIVNNYF
ncbi:UNVERIFIED_CONTAM: hypothetical protein FKN15_035646 [Acipenser sinensis]